jgi:hypothetical protein
MEQKDERRQATKRPAWQRILTRGAGTVVVFLLAVELLARWNVRREQQEREYLGDRLYADVVGDGGDPIVDCDGPAALSA